MIMIKISSIIIIQIIIMMIMMKISLIIIIQIIIMKMIMMKVLIIIIQIYHNDDNDEEDILNNHYTN